MKKVQIFITLISIVFVLNACTKQIGEFSEGLAVAKKFSLYGYINQEKKVVIPCKYEKAQKFHNGTAFTKQSGKWGAIARDEKVIIPFIYDTICNSEYGIIAHTHNKKDLYSNKGNKIIPFSFDRIKKTSVLGDNFLVENAGKYQLFSLSGEKVIPQEFDDIEPTASLLGGDILIFNNGECTLCSSTGEPILPFQFEHISKPSEGVQIIRVSKGNYKLVDESGSIKDVGGEPYEICGDMNGSYVVRIRRNGKYGFINVNGVEIIPCIYDDAMDYIYGYAKVKRNGKWGCVNDLCIEVIPCIYDDVVITRDVHDVRDVAIKSKGKWAIGTVSKTSKVSPHNIKREFTRDDFIYDDVIAFGDQFIIKDSYGYARLSFELDAWAMEYVENKYYITHSLSAHIKVLNHKEYALYENGAWYSKTIFDGKLGCEEIRDGGAFKKDGKWGIYNRFHEKLLVQNEYDEIGQYQKNERNIEVVPARKGGNWYYLDRDGNVYNEYSNSMRYCGSYVQVDKYSPNKLSTGMGKRIARLQSADGSWRYTGLPESYVEAHDFRWGAARVKDTNGEVYFIDYNGERVFPNKSIYITDIQPFQEGFAIVHYSDGRYGYIDKKGNPRFARYEVANNFKNGRAVVADDASWCTFEIDTNGKDITSSYKYTAEANKTISNFVNGMKTGGVNSLIENSEKTYQHVMNYVISQTQGMP